MSALKITTAGLGALLFVSACGGDSTPLDIPPQFHVEITSVNGNPIPAPDAPLPANGGKVTETWTFTIEARNASGDADPSFNGVVRLSTRPGAISRVIGEGAVGRNIQLKNGKVAGSVELTAIYGPARLWVDDLGYIPAKPGKKPACSNGTRRGSCPNRRVV